MRWEPMEEADRVGWYPKGKRRLKWKYEWFRFEQTNIMPIDWKGMSVDGGLLLQSSSISRSTVDPGLPVVLLLCHTWRWGS